MIHALAVALALGLAAQPDAAPPASLVHLLVTATDARGQGVDDLQAADFRIVEGDTARPAGTVRLVRAGGAPVEGTPAPIFSVTDERIEAAREGTRVVGIFLDEYHVASDAAAVVRQALREFVDTHLGPRDLVVLLKPLDSLLRIRATRDLDAVRAAIASFEGRKGRFEPRNQFEETFIAASPARVETVRSQISTSVLNAIVTHLAQLPGGRKAVIVASEGFDRGPRRRGEALPTPAGLVRSAHRAGIAIHALDPRPDPPPASPGGGDAPGEAAVLEGRAMLQELADRTDGLAMLGPTAWRDGFARVMTLLSHYYIVGFEAAAPADGRFHRVEVGVTRAGIAVHAPAGYWTDSPLERLRVSMASRETAPAPPPLPIRRTSPLIRPWFGVARGDEGFARVSFVWEAVERQPGARRRPADPAQVSMRVVTLEGTPVFEGVVTPAEPGAGETSLASFDAPEGRLRIELSIEDAAATRLDIDVRDVVIDVPRGEVALGDAAVFRARTARDLRALRDDPRAVPTPSRTFSRTEQLLIRLPVYGSGGGATLTATVLSRAGRAMRTLAGGPGPVPGQQQVDLPLAGLPSGEYRLELTASEGDRTVSEALDFRVVP